jgi:hypothetical protein
LNSAKASPESRAKKKAMTKAMLPHMPKNPINPGRNEEAVNLLTFLIYYIEIESGGTGIASIF